MIGRTFAPGQKERTSFGKIRSFLPLPNLIDVQRKSYEDFLQMDLLPEERQDVGLQAVFKSVFPFSDFRETCALEFVSYRIGEWKSRSGRLEGLQHLRFPCAHCGAIVKVKDPRATRVECGVCGHPNANKVTIDEVCGTPVELRLPYSVAECQERGATYSVPLKVTFRLKVFDKENAPTGKGAPKEWPIRDIKEEEVYFGEIPLMTDNGTFVINGTERVIVSQLHRSPGVFFTREGAHTLIGKIIPYRGSWVEFEIDPKGLFGVRIDRKRKFPGTVFLRALGLESDELILKKFYSAVKLTFEKGRARLVLPPDVLAKEELRLKHLRGIRKDGRIFADVKLTAEQRESLGKGESVEVSVDPAKLGRALFAADVVDLGSGEVLFETGSEIPEDLAAQLESKQATAVEAIFPDWEPIGETLIATLRKDGVKTKREALLEIYKRMRPGDPPTDESAKNLFAGMFFDPRKYDFSRVGRFKFNIRTGLSTSLDQKTLTAEDFYVVIEHLLELKRDIGKTDDIDNLGNRRVRCVGELLENQFRIGLVRMERAIKEKMSVHQDIDSAMPHDLINSKPVIAAIKEFFGSSQLSQFMDQTNPLSEVTHKRRLSALGPGGLSRERAGFEVRDVHATHYGRICPIETPEGPNIGLISSLSCFARISEFGFIESPYKKVRNGRVLDHYEIVTVGDSGWKKGQIVEAEELEEAIARLKKGHKRVAVGRPTAFFQPAWEEENYTIAQANAEVDDKGRFTDDRIVARAGGEFITIEKDKIEFMDVSPKQLVSVAAALIPFLEHDDANRALMGSNMQRQSVPLLRTEPPLVGTGLEGVVARDSGAVVMCKRDGIVDTVDARRIIVRVQITGEDGETKDFGADIYPLLKFRRSNQNTCINQKPIVKEGDRVVAGQVLADGPCTSQGELALGRNILVAFMPWRGYNYEDAILISEKMVKEDYYTSIHIEEFEIEARETKLGAEEITKDIPNVSEHALRDLDDSGIVRIGANVKPGDILVGKVTPKGETQLTPEEKLLRAIFGEKAGDVRDASLKCPPGIEGVVVDVKIFTRKDEEKQKDARAKQILDEEIGRLTKNADDEIRIIRTEAKEKIESLLAGRTVLEDVSDSQGNVLVKEGGKLTVEKIGQMTPRMLKGLKLKDEEIRDQVRLILQRTDSQIDVIKKVSADRVTLLAKGDELAPGVNKTVKVFVAMKRKLQVGDKMAGRHGNKGVISRILPEEDMPYLPDGTPVEIVLNPLGVPSRMNVGQILETHLGWAAKALGLNIATPVFDGCSEEEIRGLLRKSDLPTGGKTVLYDGMTGSRFEQEVTVGYIYMLKLSHLVDDKIHARSIGPYSLITQQPLGGKAQFGGQRFGEMEVWALEAYGAAYTLQELLTVKSDDVEGRSKVYEAIVKGEVPDEPGLPESFNVLVRELQSLCLDVELLKV
ncbi:MAG TPA: DNA-directed RNA polymerase subunit beta [Thermoanaerobaculia bacterium]|nr:DNA-directed RNA polymerase subunit beta [Thermoanaerobaculia bacterium]